MSEPSSSTCRLCTRQCEEMLPIFNPEALAKRIMWVSQLKIDRDDGLPTEICRECNLSVNSAYQFKELCWTSDEELRKHGGSLQVGDNAQLKPRGLDNEPQVKMVVKVEVEEDVPPWAINGICDDPPEVLETEIVETSPYEEVIDGAGGVDQPCHRRAKCFYCAICGESFKKIFAFIMHMKTHLPDVLKDNLDEEGGEASVPGNRSPAYDDTFSCAICHATYKSKKLFVAHIQTHDRRAKDEGRNDLQRSAVRASGYPCAICYETFSAKPAFIAHIQATHSREKHSHHYSRVRPSPPSSAATAFSCPACGASFDKRSSLAVHFRRHAAEARDGGATAANENGSERAYTCAICEASYKHKSSFISHIRLHTTEKRYECPDCSKRFTSHSDLTRHYRCHTGEKPFRCSVCEKPFARQDHLAKHGRTHTGYKPYTCGECDLSFSEKKSLASHLRSHSGDKPFECDACGKSFARLENYSAHARTHAGRKPFCCQHCPKSFVEKRGLQRHTRKNHAGRAYR